MDNSWYLQKEWLPKSKMIYNTHDEDTETLLSKRSVSLLTSFLVEYIPVKKSILLFGSYSFFILSLDSFFFV